MDCCYLCFLSLIYTCSLHASELPTQILIQNPEQHQIFRSEQSSFRCVTSYCAGPYHTQAAAALRAACSMPAGLVQQLDTENIPGQNRMLSPCEEVPVADFNPTTSWPSSVLDLLWAACCSKDSTPEAAQSKCTSAIDHLHKYL